MGLAELAEAEEQLKTEVHTVTSPQSESKLQEMQKVLDPTNKGIKTTEVENRGPAKKSMQSRKDSLQQVVVSKQQHSSRRSSHKIEQDIY